MMNDGSTAGCAAKPERMPQVREQMERIEKAVSQVDDSMGRLEDRLHAVLRQEPPGGKECAERPQLVQLADVLMSFADRVAAIDNRVNNMIERLEL